MGSLEAELCTHLPQSIEFQLEESCHIVKLHCFNILGEIYPVECELNHSTLHDHQLVELVCHYMVLYYNELGQRKTCAICVTQKFKHIEKSVICYYKLKINDYSWQVIEDNKLEIKIRSVLEMGLR